MRRYGAVVGKILAVGMIGFMIYSLGGFLVDFFIAR